MDDLKRMLAGMRDAAPQKDYAAEPQSLVTYGDWFFSYCVEKTVVGPQPTLAVSRLDFQSVLLPPEMRTAIDEVFGFTRLMTYRTYPKRGETLLLVF